MASKTMMKKTKLEEYTEQKQQAAELAAQISQRVQQSVDEFQSLKAQYESFVRSSLTTGADNAAEIDVLASKVDEAERIARRRRDESGMAQTNDVVTITPADVLADFQTNVGPAFKDAKVKPALEAVQAAKVAYAEAVYAYKDVEAEAKALEAEYVDALGSSYTYKFGNVLPHTRQEFDRYFFRGPDVEAIQLGEVPVSLKSEVQR